LKKQPREKFVEKNVIYILTTDLLKKERRYILGKATNLTNRLSTYNKSDEHQVVFYSSCPNKEKMSLVEGMVFDKLEVYRERANRERFILPVDRKIDLFSETIKKCIDFVK
jgi:chaperonin GroEL (HSP60 family)